MAYVVTEPCTDCKFTYCVSVCPVDAFREASDRLYIDPDACIDCCACVSECPVEAIYAELDVPAKWLQWIQMNADEAPKYPPLLAAKDPLLGPKCINPEAG